MLSLYVKPITVDNKKNEILYSDYSIEWKKQVATVSMKKGLSADEFIIQKILVKIDVDRKDERPFIFCKFKYIPEDRKDREIFLVCNPTEKCKSTELYFTSHIPIASDIIILNNIKTITKSRQCLKVPGMVLGFCIDITNYYLEEINIHEYIDFVQNEVDDISSSSDDNLSDITEDEDEEDEESNVSNSDNNESDNELESNDESADNNEADENHGTDNEGTDNDALDENSDSTSECETADGNESVEEVDIVDDVDVPSGDIDVIDDIEDSQLEVKKNSNSKPKTIKQLNMDISVLFNILKIEDTRIIIPENQLHPKRQININILKKLSIPIKTIQMIEKGIYNYTIEKCNEKSIIPIWENQEFIEIYVSKSKNLYSNLNTSCYVKNSYLLDTITSGKINAYDIAFLDTYKLYPEKWMHIIEEKTKLEKILKDSLIESATDLFECPRCHKRKTIYCEVQTRSSDEPMTKFITCVECGCKWKKY